MANDATIAKYDPTSVENVYKAMATIIGIMLLIAASALGGVLLSTGDPYPGLILVVAAVIALGIAVILAGSSMLDKRLKQPVEQLIETNQDNI